MILLDLLTTNFDLSTLLRPPSEEKYIELGLK